jgi:hypothetical protein
MSSSQQDNKLPQFRLFALIASFKWILALLVLPIKLVKAQAPAPDLAQYPSGLATLAVVSFYAVSSKKDNLSHRRRIAGFGAEHIVRDTGHGPRKGRDAKFKGIVFSRKSEKCQRNAWQVLFVPFVDGKTLLGQATRAFSDLPDRVRDVMQAQDKFGTEGHWIAGVAMFSQVMRRFPGGSALLDRCVASREKSDELRAIYSEMRLFLLDKTNEIGMPEITGKEWPDLKKLDLRVDTWEGGGRPVFMTCSTFVQVIGYCANYTYGQLMAGAHLSLPRCTWASDLYIQFLHHIDITSSRSEIVHAMDNSLTACVFYQQECDLRTLDHRLGTFLVSFFVGNVVAFMISLGSSGGSWISVTSAAAVDPKPTPGFTSAAWGYASGRLAHMEAKSNPVTGKGVVCLKRSIPWMSFRPDIEQDILWQLLIGVASILVLVFKYPLRVALGFSIFVKPQGWIFILGIVATGLAMLPTLLIPIWAWKNGRITCFLHACLISLVGVVAFGLRVLWQSRTSINDVRSFWIADAVVWIHCLLCSLFSRYLDESTEYPVTGFIWAATWLLAIGSTGAGVPRRI